MYAVVKEKYASGSERTATVERTQVEARSLNHAVLAASIPRSHPVGYESRQYPGDLAISVELKRNSKLPPARQDEDAESRAFN